MVGEKELFYRGLYYQRLGNLEDAVRVYRDCLAATPENLGAMNNLGACLVDLGQTHEAVEILSRASKHVSNDPEVLNNLGNALQRSLRVEEARHHFEASFF
mgnify:FL=1